MRRSAWPSVLVGVAAALLHTSAAADPGRVESSITPACAGVTDAQRARLNQALGGARVPELRASLAIDALEAGYLVTIELSEGAERRGTTRLLAVDCEEAIDAATVVLALALGKVPPPPTTEAASRLPSPPDAEPSPAARSGDELVAPASFAAAAPTPGTNGRASPDRSAPLETAVVGDSAPAPRIAIATGVDGGTLPRSTLTLAGAIVRPLGKLELAAIARYGLPVAEETVEAGASDRQRHDFGALELRACRGLGGAVRVGICGGTELGVVRAEHHLRGDGDVVAHAERVSARLSGTLAAQIARRGGLVEPGLELTGAAVALGREASAPWLVLRVAASAAVAF